MPELHVILLAAGQGTRMRSALPKVLHTLAGKPLLHHVLDATQALGASDVHVVIGHGAAQVQNQCAEHAVQWVVQEQQLGTGHAVAQALPSIPDHGLVLVLYGDVPLIDPTTLQPLVKAASEGKLALLTVLLDDPSGYGRILRDEQDAVIGIVEQKDATESQRAICEINTGILAVPAARLKQWIARLDNQNSQGEFYLTDVVSMAAGEAVEVVALHADDPVRVEGINDRAQLARLERVYQRRQADVLMHEGVALADPARIDVRGLLRCGSDVFIDINCVFEGHVVLGDGVTIEAGCVLRDCQIGSNSVVHPYSVIEGATLASKVSVGPFARLRPGARLQAGSRVGNFVEVKNAEVGEGSKVNHLSYVGDARLGKDVNIGAGTITCNYDGANKHHTEIGDRVFVGSNSALVAPVTLEADATIGAGSVISKDAPPAQLTLSRAKQVSLPNWKRPQKKPKE
jgi:bifunctional UDP-N-acetylglucosamine pyrophosphorylase/glucosamine-1-phosphate N-acetyltransferase